MKNKMTTVAVIAMTMLSLNSWAQNDSTVNQLTFGINYRLHGEACGGGLPKDADHSADASDTDNKSYFLQSRLQLNVDYSRPGIMAHAVIENKNIWGNQNSQSLNLYEGWVKLSARNGLFTQVGRVALSYDDERIIGPNDFATAALSHDVLILGYEGHGHKVHAILGYNQNGFNVYKSTYYDSDQGEQAYKTLQTLWYHYDVPKFPLGVSALFINFGLQAGHQDPTYWDHESNPARTVYQQMFGGYIKYHPKFMTLEGSYYRQTGKFLTPYKQAGDIRAWMASVKASVKPAEQYAIEVGYDYLSGDDYVPVTYGGHAGLPRHEVNRGFTPLYGSTTKFYGILDYFYQSAHINGFTPGLQNVFIGGNCTPTSKLYCSATYHYLATGTELNNLNRTLGHSIDLMASYQFTKDISLTAGYTLMFSTETMNRLKQGEGSKTARWGWFSLVVSPSLFTAKW